MENNSRSPNQRARALVRLGLVLQVSGTEKRKRAKAIQVRLSDEEFAQIREVADRAGLTLGSHARQALLSAPPPRAVRRPPIDRTAIAQVLADLGPIGSDIRQLADTLKTSDADPATRAQLAATIERLNDTREALMRALRRDP